MIARAIAGVPRHTRARPYPRLARAPLPAPRARALTRASRARPGDWSLQGQIKGKGRRKARRARPTVAAQCRAPPPRCYGAGPRAIAA